MTVVLIIIAVLAVLVFALLLRRIGWAVRTAPEGERRFRRPYSRAERPADVETQAQVETQQTTEPDPIEPLHGG